jgi:beta-xylosidase
MSLQVITRHSQLNMRTTEPSGGLWAPTIRYHKGRFYVSVGCTHRFRPKEWVGYYSQAHMNLLKQNTDISAGYYHTSRILRFYNRHLGLIFLV